MMDAVRRENPPKRRFSGTWATLSTLLRKKSNQMSEGRRSQVVLLDERRLDIVIQSRLYAGELLDIVASHFNLKEKEYFGISFIDECGQYSWLHLDKRVLEHDFPKKSTSQGSTLILYFRIKYFVESITQLRDSATIEAFYLQTKSLIAKGELEIDSEIIFQLAALVIQATYGDFTDEQTFKTHLKRLPVLPTSTLKEFPSISACETQVLEHYRVLAGQTRGAAIVNYLSIVESLPTYGQHYYEVKDKAGNPCWLSLSYRGISQYDKNDRRTPRRVFLWKQLENLYFRDRKFTVEVHEARRVVHTLSSFNLYEDAIEEPVEEFDDLSNAICDPTTQVSVSRRALAPASVTVYVWYAASPNIAKCIWSMAIAQHQFFLDRNHKKSVGRIVRSLSQIASELSRSVQSLSSASSQSNISRSNSSASLPTIVIEGELSEESKAATIEMLAALQSRKDALQDALKKKTEELKSLCLKEGEIIGELPPETPFQPGEAQPQVRRRIGTSFTISDKVFYKAKGKDRETLNELELEYEIQSKIASAAFKLANDQTARKSVRKLRKVSYVQAATKLRNIEEKLSTLKREKESQKKELKTENDGKDKGVNLLGLPMSSSENSISDRSNLNSTLSASSVPPSTSLPQLTEGTCSSAPPSPAKCRQRHQSLQHVPIITDDVYEDVIPYNVHTRRNSSSYSAEYDAASSCGSSSLASLGIPYRNRFEANLDIEGTNHYSVPNRRASQVFNDPDILLDNKSQDATNHSCADANNSVRYLNTPLSCSYDDRLSYSKSGGYSSPLKDSIYDKASIDSNGMDNLSCAESTYIPMTYGPKSIEKFNHSFSENSLHRSHPGSLHHKLNQMHISEPHLNLENVDTVDGIHHVYSIPTLKNVLRPINNGVITNSIIPDYCSGINSQSISQVADLVQASVLLQDCKRAASSSSLEYSAPKIKTKEWIETSLDSPIVERKKKPNKILEPCVKNEPAQPAHWLENGLPPIPNHSDSFYAYPHHQSYYDGRKFSQSGSDLRKSPSPLLVQGLLSVSAEYRNANNKCQFPSQRPCESPHSNSNQSVFLESNQYRHYENISELSSDTTSHQQNQSHSFYEDMHPPSDYNLVAIKKVHDNNTQTLKHLSHNYSERSSNTFSVAQPQEPPKRPTKRISAGDCYIVDSMPGADVCEYNDSSSSEIYEPVNFQDMSHRNTYPQKQHCDISERTHQYSHSYHSESLPSENDNDPLVTQNWQHFPQSPTGIENTSVSPVPSTINFSPNVEVNVVSVGHFQPYWEETKPYEISDFYKYSTKHRRQQKPLKEVNESHLQQTVEECNDSNQSQFYNQNMEVGSIGNHDMNKSSNPMNHHQQQELVNSVSAFSGKEFSESSPEYYENSPTPVLRHKDDPDKSLSLGEMELRISLADTFHDEMVTWYQSQDSVKKATLV
ncbi:FERM domain-containing protein 4B [Nephila pilipes]|uniref:FERM domain-containing protein 4B n=1 Tax=Nephila pilipes TaxID=299642 RepID=A0A8X6PMT5_NEPPI|nr:FERM domain-containing protein 4B [Nephila pilipes]